MATKKFFTVLLLATGILSIILSVYSFNSLIGASVSQKVYGGDAYTGIQNAASQTANNVREMAEMMSFSFGSILLVGGLTLIFSSCNMLISYAQQSSAENQSNTYNSEPDTTITTINNADTTKFACPKCGKIVTFGTASCDCGQVFDWTKM